MDGDLILSHSKLVNECPQKVREKENGWSTHEYMDLLNSDFAS